MTKKLKDKKVKPKMCLVLREVEIPMAEIKKGDLFKIKKHKPKDKINESQIYLAKRDAKLIDGNPTIELDFMYLCRILHGQLTFFKGLSQEPSSGIFYERR